VEHQIQRLLNTSELEYSAVKQEEASVSEILVAAEVITPKGSRQPTLVGFVYPGKSAFNKGDSQSQKRCAAAVQSMVADLSERLASVLPSHMVPSAYIPLEHMPMMATGKTDRRRLREIACSFTRLDLASLSMPITRSKRLPETDAERTLQQIWARTLNLSRDFGIDESFFSLGGDSISAMQVSVAARWYGLLFSANDMILNNTVSKLAHALQTPTLERGDSPAAREAGPSNFGSDFCLSPIQQFHFQTRSPGPDLMDVPFYIRFTKSVPTQTIKDTLHAVVERHPMLRARFHHDVTGSWSQYICQKAEDSLLFHHFIESSESQKIEAITGCRETIDIEHGPSFVAILFTDLDQQTLFLSAHHLVIDFVSWRVIFQDMEDFITLRGFGLSTSSSYQEWCNFQTDYASTHLVPDNALHYEPDYSDITYWGLADEPGPETYTHRRFSLNKSISTTLLTFKSETVQFRPHELLMAALGFSFRRTFPDRNLPPIFTEGHGRDAWTESFDLSQTVGWFTTMFPVQVAPEEGEDFFDYILQTKECLQNIPRRGWSYFASKFLNEKGRQAFQNDPIEINFNFLGHFQQLERQSSLMEAISLPAGCKLEAMGPMKTVGLFDVTIIIERGEIEADFKYNTRAKHQDKIEAWIAAYKTVLLEFVSTVNDIRPS
jgi:non-ribosomal peptide synthase protein (TIGR01720 family)